MAEVCKFCGAERILNPRTGKMFCKDKCWLNTTNKTSDLYAPKVVNSNELIMDELVAINKKLDAIITKLG